MTPSRTIEWTTRDGRRAQIILTLEPALDRTGRPTTTGELAIRTLGLVGDQEVGYAVSRIAETQGCTAVIGRLGIPTAEHTRYLAALDELRAIMAADAGHQAYRTAVARGDQTHAEHEAGLREMDRAMTGHGRTY